MIALTRDQALSVLASTRNPGVWSMDRLSCDGFRASLIMALESEAKSPNESATSRRPYAIEGSVAIVEIDGVMIRGLSIPGLVADTSDIAGQVRRAAADKKVDGIMLAINSPGGYISGVYDLAEAIYAARSSKPVDAHIEELGASAAYWAASQAGKITASRDAEVGSIGVYAVVEDYSGLYEQYGIDVHVVSTGEKKGLLVEGTKVTEEALAEVRESVESAFSLFREGIQRGRAAHYGRVSEVMDGRVLISTKAVSAGLIDGIASRQEAISALNSTARPSTGIRNSVGIDLDLDLASVV